MSRPYTAPAIRRAVDVLECLAGSTTSGRISDLARELGYGKSTVLGILRTLEEVGWVEKDPTHGGFQVGTGLLALTRKAFGGREVAEIARPLLRRLADRGGESAFLGVLRGGRIVIEACIEGGHEMCIAARPGGSLPPLAGATGKVFLAGMKEEAVRAIAGKGPLVRYTRRTITDPEAFLDEVARTRDQGYGMDDEEYLRGVRAVAVPIECRGDTVAAMWVAGFSSRLTDARLAGILEELRGAADLCTSLLEAEN